VRSAWSPRKEIRRRVRVQERADESSSSLPE
jgi:hypothetical protein